MEQTFLNCPETKGHRDRSPWTVPGQKEQPDNRKTSLNCPRTKGHQDRHPWTVPGQKKHPDNPKILPRDAKGRPGLRHVAPGHPVTGQWDTYRNFFTTTCGVGIKPSYLLPFRIMLTVVASLPLCFSSVWRFHLTKTVTAKHPSHHLRWFYKQCVTSFFYLFWVRLLN